MSLARLTIVILLSCLLSNLANGIKFDLLGTVPGQVAPKCLSHYVPTGTLVVVTIKVGLGYNQRVDVEIYDNTSSHNVYGKKRDMDGETRLAFTTHADSDIFICFSNTLNDGVYPDPKHLRTIDIDVDVGAEAIDYKALASAEKLKPMEAELKKLEQVVQEIVDEMDYLKKRESRLRDTNESTNERVKWFSLSTIFILIALGSWQIIYLKKFFQKKRLID